MRLNIASLSLAAVLLVASSSAAAITQPEEWAARIKTAQSVGASGTDLFGDSTNFYSGQTSFSVTDIDLPGNDKLPMRLTRTIEAAPLTGVENSGLLGSWELDVPYISGIYAASTGWRTKNNASPYLRCSDVSNLQPPTVGASPNDWLAREYWRGLTLYVTHPLKTGPRVSRGFGKMGPVPDGESCREEVTFYRDADRTGKEQFIASATGAFGGETKPEPGGGHEDAARQDQQANAF